MKYAVIDERKNSVAHETLFVSLKQAIDKADNQYLHMTPSERNNSNFYVCSCELNEDSCVDFSTLSIIKEYNRKVGVN